MAKAAIAIEFAGEPKIRSAIVPIIAESMATFRSLKEIEVHIAALEGVADASVWATREKVFAYVSLHNYADWTVASLKESCRIDLGAKLVPDSIQLERDHPVYPDRLPVAA